MFWLVRVVDINVLQELGAERRIGSFGAGQEFKNMAVVWTQQHHGVVLIRSSWGIHRNLGQLEPTKETKKDFQFGHFTEKCEVQNQYTLTGYWSSL